MKNVLGAALIGAGIALVAFVVDWLFDRLDETDEAEPLWPPGKPFSKGWVAGSSWGYDDLTPSEPPTEEEKARIKAWVNEEIEKRMTGG